MWFPIWECLNLFSSHTALPQLILDAALGRWCPLQNDVVWLRMLLSRFCAPCLAARVVEGVAYTTYIVDQNRSLAFKSPPFLLNHLRECRDLISPLQLHSQGQSCPELGASSYLSPSSNPVASLPRPVYKQVMLEMSQPPWGRDDDLGWNQVATGTNTWYRVKGHLFTWLLFTLILKQDSWCLNQWKQGLWP